jgi:hypothetical protein
VTLKIVEISLDQIVPARWRGDSTTPEKVSRAKEAFTTEGILQPATVRLLPSTDSYAPGKYELSKFHNRRRAAIELGYSVIPCVVVEATDIQFFEMYMKDNSEVDRPATSYALITVRKAFEIVGPEFRVQYGTAWEAHLLDFIARSMGLRETRVRMLRDMNQWLDAGELTSKIEQVRDIDSATSVAGVFHRNSVVKAEQEIFLEQINTNYGPDVWRQARDTFNANVPRKRKAPVSIQEELSHIAQLLRGVTETIINLDEPALEYEDQVTDVLSAVKAFQDLFEVEPEETTHAS